MEQEVAQLITNLEAQVGTHRDLLDLVRMERTHLVELNLEDLSKVTHHKHLVIHQIQKLEKQRQTIMLELGAYYMGEEPTLAQIKESVQQRDSRAHERLESIDKTLNLLIERIQIQNRHNMAVVESSLKHVTNMKKNVLGEVVKTAETYTKRGTKDSPTRSAHLFQKEI